MVQMFGMIQRGCGPCLSLKARQCVRISRKVIRQKLERDETMQTNVFGFVDHAHATIADLLDDAVVRDSLIEHGIAVS